MEMKYIEKHYDDCYRVKIDKLPFKITNKICKSYIKLHFFDLEINNEILDKCNIIFNLLLRYSNSKDSYIEYINNGVGRIINYILTNNNNFWSIKHYITPLIKFNLILNNTNLQIEWGNYDNYINEIIDNKYNLKDLLTDNIKYDIFIDYWSKQYDYYDIYNVMKDIMDKYEAPKDLIDEIICLGF